MRGDEFRDLAWKASARHDKLIVREYRLDRSQDVLLCLDAGHRMAAPVRGLRKRLFVEPVPPRAIRPELPTWLQEIILRCLEVKPERRYQSAAQLALDLREPSGVALTARAEKLQVSGGVRRLKRWFFALGAEPAAPAPAGQQLARSPIVMAAVDVDNATPELLAQLCETVRRIVVELRICMFCLGVRTIEELRRVKLRRPRFDDER